MLMNNCISITKFTRFLIALFLLTALVSCTYKPTDEYFREIHLVPPAINFSNSSGPDTLLLTNSSAIEIHVDPGGDYQYYLEVLVNGKTNYSGLNATADFTFGLWYMNEPGTFPAHFVLYADTKSGSIIETLGTEAYVFTKDITIVRYPLDYYSQLTLLNASGGLQGTVNVSPGAPPVVKIVVSRYSRYIPAYEIASGPGSFPFTFYDKSYMGETATYIVKTFFGTRLDTTFYSAAEDFTTKIKEFPDLEITTGTNGLPVIHWQKTSYPDQCAGYRITNRLMGLDPFEIEIISDLDQTTLEVNDIGFPGWNGICVTYLPENPPPDFSMNSDSYSICTSFNAGEPSFAFTGLLNPVGDDFFTTRYDYTLDRYSAQTLTVTENIIPDNVFNSVSVSPNNKYLLVSLDHEFKYLFYDIGTHSKTFIPASQVIGSGFSQGIVSVSDGGVAAVAVGKKIVLYDFVSQQKLNETYFGQEASAEISPSGKYFFARADKIYLYSFTGGNVSEKWHSTDGTSGYNFYSFLPGDDEQAIIVKDRVLSVRRCIDWSLVRRFPMDIATLGNIDFNSRRIFGYDQEYFRIYDFETGNLLKQMRVAAIDGPLLKFRGNTLFYGRNSKLILF
jgi:hypothetical protein